MSFGIPGLKRAFAGISVLAVVCLFSLSCQNYNNNRNRIRVAAKFRVFVSNPLQPTFTGLIQPVLDVVDGSNDLITASTVSLLGTLPDAGMMVLSPDKSRTLVFSPSSNQLAIINNATETATPTTAITLPGTTESFFVADDNANAYVAVPTAPVAGQSPGVVVRIDVATGRITATIPVPRAHFLVTSPAGNQVLIFSDNSDTVTLLKPSLIDSGNPLTPVQNAGGCSRNLDQPNPCSFDHPVWAVFNKGGSAAYVLNCGPQCGGPSVSTQCDPSLASALACASVALVDLSGATPNVAGILPVSAATTGLLSGTTLYVAGTPASASLSDCSGITTAATTCGRLTIIDPAGFAVANSSQLPISDGYHKVMQMGANGQLFIGAQNCTNINLSGGEVRGCLSIVNTASGVLSDSTITVPPKLGNVTGIEPIPNRSVVYVCQGGELGIYDTVTDQLQKTQVSIVGRAIDVKAVDF